jgi:hypothetical protein
VPDLALSRLVTRLNLAVPQDVKNLLEVLEGISRVFSGGGNHRSGSAELAPGRTMRCFLVLHRPGETVHGQSGGNLVEPLDSFVG